MSGFVLLVSWCLVGGAVGGAIGKYSGRLGLGLVLGSFCGVFGWVLLAGAAPRQHLTAAPPIPADVADPVDDIAEPPDDVVDTRLPAPLAWVSRHEDQPMVATAGQL